MLLTLCKMQFWCCSKEHFYETSAEKTTWSVCCTFISSDYCSELKKKKWFSFLALNLSKITFLQIPEWLKKWLHLCILNEQKLEERNQWFGGIISFDLLNNNYVAVIPHHLRQNSIYANAVPQHTVAGVHSVDFIYSTCVTINKFNGMYKTTLI